MAMHEMEIKAIGFRPNRSARNPEYVWLHSNPANPSEAKLFTIALSQKILYWVMTVSLTQLLINSYS